MATARITQPSLLSSLGVASSVWTALAAYFATFGWVQTADTGQINLASPPTANLGPNSECSGYQIWGMNDTLQGTTPVYMKIWYAITSLSGNPGCGFYAQFGTATDGAGNLTGTQVSQILRLSNGTYTSVVQNCYLSGDNNRLTWNLWDGPTQYEGMNLGVERTKDASGNDTSDGLLILTRSNRFGSSGQGAGLVNAQFFPASSGIGLPGNGQPLWPAALNMRQNTMATATLVGTAFPIPFNGAPKLYGKNFMLYQSTDFPAYTTQSLPAYGSNHNYLVCTPNAFSPCQPPALARVLMRYE